MGTDVPYQEPFYNKPKPGEREKCVMCGDDTPYFFNTPITERHYYVEGAGQLCMDCYDDIYHKDEKKNRKK